MPRFFLLRNGVDPDRDFARVAFSGAHDVTAKWVEAGKVDAGVLNESIWQRLLDEKKIDPAKVRVLWTTPEYYGLQLDGPRGPRPEARREAAGRVPRARPGEPGAPGDPGPAAGDAVRPHLARGLPPIEEAARAAGLLGD